MFLHRLFSINIKSFKANISFNNHCIHCFFSWSLNRSNRMSLFFWKLYFLFFFLLVCSQASYSHSDVAVSEFLVVQKQINTSLKADLISFWFVAKQHSNLVMLMWIYCYTVILHWISLFECDQLQIDSLKMNCEICYVLVMSLMNLIMNLMNLMHHCHFNSINFSSV